MYPKYGANCNKTCLIQTSFQLLFPNILFFFALYGLPDVNKNNALHWNPGKINRKCKFSSLFIFRNGFGFPGQTGGGLPQPQATQDPRTLGCGATQNGCIKSRYRTYDGSCNNLDHPTWGTPQTRYARLLPQNYGDGKKYVNKYIIKIDFT